MVQLLKQIVPFILRCLTVNHRGLPHYIKKCLPYSNNLQTLLSVLGSLNKVLSSQKLKPRQAQLFDVNMICAGCEVLHRGWLTSSSPDRIRKVIFGNQYYEQDVQMLCSDAISCPICLPSFCQFDFQPTERKSIWAKKK